MSELAPLALADRLFTAIGDGDLDVVGECLHPDAAIWTNFDERTVDRDRALRTIGWLVANVTALRYDVVRRLPCEGGFVQQHVLRGVSPTGATIAMHACIVAEVRDGRVVRMDEYADPSGLMAAMA